MKYIIMCGGYVCDWQIPKHLWKYEGVPIVARTIKLLRKYGVQDIAITTSPKCANRYKCFKVPIIEYEANNKPFYWVDAFYPTVQPICYIFGDVVFSEDAIKTIVQTETNDIEFFASAPPFADNYPKRFAEPFAFKVVDQKKFRNSVWLVKEWIKQGVWHRHPIAWELWQIIQNTEPNKLRYDNYTIINDYTCDIDSETEINQWGVGKVTIPRKRKKMANRVIIHTCENRKWYVDKYLVPSLLEQVTQVEVAVDTEHLGNLEHCMKIFSECDNDDMCSWHLQDDVIVCKDFGIITKQYLQQDEGKSIICGIATRYDKDRKDVKGITTVKNMWYSFPCIRIPNKVARECADWYYKYMQNNPVYKHLVKVGKHDDELFRMYLKTKRPDIQVINAVPNLVEHIDWMIGGSTVNAHRDERIQALYFNDDELVKELEVKLNG